MYKRLYATLLLILISFFICSALTERIDFMNPPKTLSGPRVMPKSGQAPKQLVILLHGLGADGNDLIGLADEWKDPLPDAEFISPNAPFPCDMAPFGYQWFSLQSFAPESIYKGATEAATILNPYIDHELSKRNLTDANLALVGFSQGTMMALHVALRRPQSCAGVLGFSGALTGADSLKNEIQSKPEILLFHGDQDMVVPIQAMYMAEKTLKDLNCPVKTNIRQGLGHGIDAYSIQTGGVFLKNIFDKTSQVKHARPA